MPPRQPSRRRRWICSLGRPRLAKAQVDVSVAQADLAVADSDARRMKAWVGYLTLTAPFDGVIVARNANTGDFVLPATGIPRPDARFPICLPAAVPRRSTWSIALDVVRVSVDVPEQDANYVQIGTKASVWPGRSAILPFRVRSRAPPGP